MFIRVRRLSMRVTWAVIIILGIASQSGCTAGTSTPAPPRAVDKWDDRPLTVAEVRFPALDAAIAEQRGKVVVIDFWALWCKPCIEKFPHLVEVQKKYLDRGLVCMSLSRDKEGGKPYDREAVLGFLKKMDARFPNFVIDDFEADEVKLKERFGMGDGLPFLAVLDREGKMIWNTERDVKSAKKSSEELDLFLATLFTSK
jgi:thiol-disulfide isomerase/thioredoxin